MTNYGIIILAAGASTRLGQPKQLLEFNGKTLLKHVVDEAISVVNGSVLLVLGANELKVAAEMQKLTVQTVVNYNWEEGMSSSIKTGLEELLKIDPATEEVILTVCDQPFITSDLFRELILAKKQSGKGIVACAYGNAVGTPVIIDKKYFDDLLSLSGKGGAKTLIEKYDADLTKISFPLGNIDIDTPEDYNKLLNNQFNLPLRND